MQAGSNIQVFFEIRLFEIPNIYEESVLGFKNADKPMETHLIHNEMKIKCSNCYQRGMLDSEVERRTGLTNRPQRQWKDSRFTCKSNSTYKQRFNMYLNNWTQTVKSAKVSYKNIYSNINTVSLCISENFHFPFKQLTSIFQCVLYGKLALWRLMILFLERLCTSSGSGM